MQHIAIMTGTGHLSKVCYELQSVLYRLTPSRDTARLGSAAFTAAIWDLIPKAFLIGSNNELGVFLSDRPWACANLKFMLITRYHASES